MAPPRLRRPPNPQTPTPRHHPDHSTHRHQTTNPQTPYCGAAQVYADPAFICVAEELGACLKTWASDVGSDGSGASDGGCQRGAVPAAQMVPKGQLAETVDVVVCLGGDGTLLWASSLFPRAMPPVISFAMGSLGAHVVFFSVKVPRHIPAAAATPNKGYK